MKKLLLIFIMMATWMVVGCETVRQVKAGCFGHWVEHTDGSRSGHKKGTIGLIDIMLHLIDNVWKMQSHIKIQRRGHTDENDITNFGNVIFE